MARMSDTERGIGYPKLEADQISALISAAMISLASSPDGGHGTVLEGATAYLINFYTHRWGLPPSIRDRAGYPDRP